MIKTIHIIAFDNPYPPNYGGAIDVYNKIKALAELGILIKLHCFTYGNRNNLDALNDICETVYRYERNESKLLLLNKKPYITLSRRSEKLIENLMQDQDPILFEGLHTCSLLESKKLTNRTKIVRMHNIEHLYYRGLAKTNAGFFKRLFYTSEAVKLKNYEPILKNADKILAISPEDKNYFSKYCSSNYVPAFHNDQPENIPVDEFALFHGNLQVKENESALIYLLEYVMPYVEHQIIVAGQNPSQKMAQKIQQFDHIELIESPTQQKMKQLIATAKCHLFYTNQNTGIKLKLVHALFSKGHIVMNEKMVFDTLCRDELNIASNQKEMVETINKLMGKDIVSDRNQLKSIFDNRKNAEFILDLMKD